MASRKKYDRPIDVPCTYPACPKLFRCNFDLQAHIRAEHTLEYPYICQICVENGATRGGKRCGFFALAASLNRHMRSVHKDYDFKVTKPAKGKTPIGNVPGGSAASEQAQEAPEVSAAPEPLPKVQSSQGRVGIPLDHCTECGAYIEDLDDGLRHYHLIHFVLDPSCRCSMCLEMSEIAPQLPVDQPVQRSQTQTPATSTHLDQSTSIFDQKAAFDTLDGPDFQQSQLEDPPPDQPAVFVQQPNAHQPVNGGSGELWASQHQRSGGDASSRNDQRVDTDFAGNGTAQEYERHTVRPTGIFASPAPSAAPRVRDFLWHFNREDNNRTDAREEEPNQINQVRRKAVADWHFGL